MQIAQIGMNTSDIAGSLRFYSEVFGFRNAGAQALWGSSIGIQGLEPDARALLWWMIGEQPFFQLEIYQHSNPAQRPLRADWRPCDHGWTRFGVSVADLATCQSALSDLGVAILGKVTDRFGTRLAFRDPFLGVIIEAREDPDVTGPHVIYVASSVADIDQARRYYGDLLGLPLVGMEALQTEASDALWGLEGAKKDGFLVDAGNMYLEIAAYHKPRGRPRPEDYRGSDQGIVNVGLGSRVKADIAGAFDRLAGAGLHPLKLVEKGDFMTGYITEPGHELEILAVPEAFDTAFGFKPANDFFR
jgi:catechol 2,3-dioxygenase-like lactoylglutathione lyase family enzyme